MEVDFKFSKVFFQFQPFRLYLDIENLVKTLMCKNFIASQYCHQSMFNTAINRYIKSYTNSIFVLLEAGKGSMYPIIRAYSPRPPLCFRCQ